MNGEMAHLNYDILYLRQRANVSKAWFEEQGRPFIFWGIGGTLRQAVHGIRAVKASRDLAKVT